MSYCGPSLIRSPKELSKIDANGQVTILNSKTVFHRFLNVLDLF